MKLLVRILNILNLIFFGLLILILLQSNMIAALLGTTIGILFIGLIIIVGLILTTIFLVTTKLQKRKIKGIDRFLAVFPYLNVLAILIFFLVLRK